MITSQQETYRVRFAQSAAAAFQRAYPAALASDPQAPIFHADGVLQLLETPRDPSMGRFALPLFKQARLLGAAPPHISATIADAINADWRESSETGLHCTGLGGYINVKVSSDLLAADVLGAICSHGTAYGSSQIGSGKKIVIEYSSPNIAKPFGVGHLRSTAIGHSLCRILRKLGFTVIGINFPGDWGTQFGKMIVAWEKWGHESMLVDEAVKQLLALYVRFHTEAEAHPELEDEARSAFQRLEAGDPAAVRLWQLFRDISNREFERVYQMLGVSFEAVISESFFNDKMDGAIARLQAAGLTRESQGALIVETEDPNLPPALLRKRDGATLYTTRDLAGLIYRWEHWQFDESLYVVGTAQADHFRVCFNVMRQLEEAERQPADHRMTGRLKHIEFGWVKFGEKTMSTRRGNIVLLDDVLATAISRITDQMRAKNPDMPQLESVARQIGVGAVIFSQLSVRRQTDVNFVWEQVLTFEGESGPYLQYTHARLASLLRNYKREIMMPASFESLRSPEELRVLELLADFPQIVEEAGKQYDPFGIAAFLFRLTGAFNRIYQRKDEQGRIVKLIDDSEPAATAQRMTLVYAVKTVVAEGLFLLGLAAPEQM